MHIFIRTLIHILKFINKDKVVVFRGQVILSEFLFVEPFKTSNTFIFVLFLSELSQCCFIMLCKYMYVKYIMPDFFI